LKSSGCPTTEIARPKELSGGQQQRIAIARCLVYDPDLILMDEPLGALDKKLRDQLQFEIKRIHETLGVTMLYVTHDQSEALVLSDRICLMDQGSVEQVGTPEELYFKPRSVFAADFLGESNILDATVLEAGDSTRLSTRGGLQIVGLPGCSVAKGKTIKAEAGGRADAEFEGCNARCGAMARRNLRRRFRLQYSAFDGRAGSRLEGRPSALKAWRALHLQDAVPEGNEPGRAGRNTRDAAHRQSALRGVSFRARAGARDDCGGV